MRPASVVALVIVVYSVVATCVRCTAQANSTDASGACRTLCERLGQAGQLTSSNSQVRQTLLDECGMVLFP